MGLWNKNETTTTAEYGKCEHQMQFIEETLRIFVRNSHDIKYDGIQMGFP